MPEGLWSSALDTHLARILAAGCPAVGACSRFAGTQNPDTQKGGATISGEECALLKGTSLAGWGQVLRPVDQLTHGWPCHPIGI